MLIAPVLVFAAALLAIQPRGEFPVNDDWQYSHVAKQLYETGRFHLDVPVAPALVGQAYFAQPWLHLFGFSHLSLRLLTMIVACGLLACLIRLLTLAATGPRTTALAVGLVALDPLFLHLTTSFMTEVYGLALAFAGAVLWLARGESRAQRKIAAALLIGVSFWIRQFSVIVWPALVIADFWSDRRGTCTRRWATDVVVGSGIVAACAGAYLTWARQTHNLRGEFTGPLLRMLVPGPSLLLHAVVGVAYMLFLTAPLLLLVARSSGPVRRKRVLFVGSALVVLGFAYLALTAAFPYVPRSNYTKHFPFLGNVLTPYGVGPLTTTDAYFDPASGLHYRVWPWVAVEIGIVALIAALPIPGRCDRVRAFGLALTVACFAAVVLAYRDAVLDRYYFPAYLGAVLFIAAGHDDEWRLPRWRQVAGAAVAGGMTFYAVAGVHDYFRWNEARWRLAGAASRLDIGPAELDGGYEYNGWMLYEHGEGVSRNCGPLTSFFCPQLPYTIGWTRRRGDRVIASEPVRSWLFRFPDLMLIERGRPKPGE